ncbi:hypothetical protein E8E12_002512 [Didymella heteroderae]|uniref:Rhodopsin domain-containing protein n=1 Tax=Didymella heteroderae TaxID=1769908 RepID=A0A9P4WNM6_9PLEO|nr:hypothetical protein E8E12_002512 [Didymella heteroderae]
MPGGPHPPLSVIATWPPPNLVNPEGRGRVTTVIAGVLSPITFFVIFARLWVRFRLQRNAGWDDWLMIAALPFVTSLAILVPYTADAYHSGVHIWDVDLTLFTIQRKLILAIEMLFVLAGGLVKVSILLFFRRLGSRGVSKTFRVITWAAIGIQIASTIAFFVCPFFVCRPISAYWEQSDVVKIIQGVKFNCYDEGAAVVAAGVVSTVQDVITALLPNFIYWKAQIPFRQKAALMGIFAIAYLAATFGALRAYATWVLFYKTYDVSWQLWEVWNWTLLELHIGVICANAPALKAFIKRYLEPIKSIASNPRGHSSQAKSSQAQSSQTGSKARSDPSEKSKKFWRNPYANHGYYSQPTQMSQRSDDELFGCEGLAGSTSDTQHTSGDSFQSERCPTNDDVELGIVTNNTTYLSPPPQVHRESIGSVGMVSVYMYDGPSEGNATNGGIQYLRVKI